MCSTIVQIENIYQRLFLQDCKKNPILYLKVVGGSRWRNAGACTQAETVSGEFSDNKFSDTECSETDFPTPNFLKQIFRQLHFPTVKFSDRQILQKYIFYTLIHVTHCTKIPYKLNMQICICSYGQMNEATVRRMKLRLEK